MPFPICFTIPNAPRTKKNHGDVIQRGRRKIHIPSQAFTNWQAWAIVALPEIRKAAKSAGFALPIRHTMNCRALFYREALTGDAVGYYQGLADLLEHHGVIENDRLIVQWDGSRLMKDAADPRTLVQLELLDPPAEKPMKGKKR